MVFDICRTMASKTAIRVAISQVLVLGGVITLFVCLGVFALDEFDEDERDTLQKGFFTCAGLYVVPLVFGIILIVGVVLQHNSIVRTWILVTIIETVVILATNLGGSIYYSASLDTYYGVIVIAVQVIVALWKMECIVLITSYYRDELVKNTASKKTSNGSVS